MRWTILVGAALAVGIGWWSWQARRPFSSVPAPSTTGGSNHKDAANKAKPAKSAPLSSAPLAPPSVRPRFVDVAEIAGIDFSLFTDTRPQRFFLPCIMGSGVAFADFDGDGWQDIYFGNGCVMPHDPQDRTHVGALFRNRGNGTFVNVTPAAGLDVSMYNQGVMTADYNEDGFPELYLSAFAGNYLFTNHGDGTFGDSTAYSGTRHHGWGSSGAFGDFDRDGILDLFVANYVVTSLETQPHCTYDEKGQKVPGYCGPGNYQGQPDVLFHGQGDGRFTDVTEAAGCLDANGKGLAVAIADFTNDGWPDLYIANDKVNNFFYENLGKNVESASSPRTSRNPPLSRPRFRERGVENGTAVMANGEPGASMGIACGDYDNDGWHDMYVPQYTREGFALYRNQQGQFVEYSSPARLRVPSLNSLGFGALFLDFDNDSWLDIFVTNGHVLGPRIEPTVMKPQLYWNDRAGAFVEVTPWSGPYFHGLYLGRSAAAGDWNNDGAIDFAVTHLDARPGLLRNDTAPRGHWLGLDLVGTRGNRSGLNARVEVTLGNRQLMREVYGGGSYLADNDHRILLGLGDAANVDQVTVIWSSGIRQELGKLATDRYWLIVEERPPIPHPAPRTVSSNTRKSP